MSGVYDWSTTADSNDVADSTINWAEGQSPASINNSARALMRRIRQYADDQGGVIITAGTGNTYTAASVTGVTTLRAGVALTIRADRANTGAATLNVDGLGAVPWRTMSGTDFGAGNIISGGFHVVYYHAAAAEWRSATGGNGGKRAAVSDANYTALVSDTYVGMATLTASRTITLPSAAGYPQGQALAIADESGACSDTKTITVAAAGGQTIAGAANVVMGSPYQKLTFHTNGSNLWVL